MAGRPFSRSSLEWSTSYPSKVSRMLGNKTCQKPAASASGCAGLISFSHVGQIRMKTKISLLKGELLLMTHMTQDHRMVFLAQWKISVYTHTLNVSNNREDNRNYSALCLPN